MSHNVLAAAVQPPSIPFTKHKNLTFARYAHAANKLQAGRRAELKAPKGKQVMSHCISSEGRFHLASFHTPTWRRGDVGIKCIMHG